MFSRSTLWPTSTRTPKGKYFFFLSQKTNGYICKNKHAYITGLAWAYAFWRLESPIGATTPRWTTTCGGTWPCCTCRRESGKRRSPCTTTKWSRFPAKVDTFRFKLQQNQVSRPIPVRGPSARPLSDAAALLFRLEMEGRPLPPAALKDRWRELAQVYDQLDSVNNFFYDFHLLAATLYGDNASKYSSVLAELTEQARLRASGENADSYNCMVADSVGLPVARALEAFHDQRHDEVIRELLPIRHEIYELVAGSHAQKDMFELMLLRSCVAVGRTRLAEQLLRERMASRSGESENEVESHRPKWQTILVKVDPLPLLGSTLQ